MILAYMVIDNNCRNQIISIIKSELNKIPPLFQGMAKIKAINEFNDFIKNIPTTEYNLNLLNFLDRHPDVKSKHPKMIRLLPQCTYQYTTGELIDCFNDIKNYI